MMNPSKELLIRDLSRLGILPGDTVLMHSSFRSLGSVEGGAATVFDALLALLGTQGTLVLPTLSYETVTKENPFFSVRTTPSCVGYLPEYFRTRVPGVLRSLHPTHSCAAWGLHAAELTRDHWMDNTPAGPHSAFAMLPKLGGKLLFLGCGVECNTTVHAVEEAYDSPYVFSPKELWHYTLEDADGTVRQADHYRHLHICGNVEYRQNYTRLWSYLTPEQYRRGPVLQAEAWLIPAKTVWDTARSVMEHDPYALVTAQPAGETK